MLYVAPPGKYSDGDRIRIRIRRSSFRSASTSAKLAESGVRVRFLRFKLECKIFVSDAVSSRVRFNWTRVGGAVRKSAATERTCIRLFFASRTPSNHQLSTVGQRGSPFLGRVFDSPGTSAVPALIYDVSFGAGGFSATWSQNNGSRTLTVLLRHNVSDER